MYHVRPICADITFYPEVRARLSLIVNVYKAHMKSMTSLLHFIPFVRNYISQILSLKMRFVLKAFLSSLALIAASLPHGFCDTKPSATPSDVMAASPTYWITPSASATGDFSPSASTSGDVSTQNKIGTRLYGYDGCNIIQAVSTHYQNFDTSPEQYRLSPEITIRVHAHCITL